MSVSLMNVLIIIWIIFLVITLIFGIIEYVFKAIGLYSISRRRKLGASGIAWIPIVSMFKFGQIADDAEANKRGSRTHYVALYPIFAIAGGVLIGISSILVTLVMQISPAVLSRLAEGEYELLLRIVQRSMEEPAFIIGMIIGVVGYILCLIASVFFYICLYHIYKSCSRKYIVMFVLCFFFSFLYPFFLFAVRKQDNPRWYRYDREEPLEPDPQVEGSWQA